MTKKTVEYAVGRNPELGVDGRPAYGPMAPVDIAEPELGSEHMLINIGPQHPATHGVLRLVCELDGETVLKVIPHIGYLHSGFEKLGEYRTWNQIVPLTDRMDYLAPLIYNCAYVMSVEELMGIPRHLDRRHHQLGAHRLASLDDVRTGLLRRRDDAHLHAALRSGAFRFRAARVPAPERRHDRRRHTH